MMFTDESGQLTKDAYDFLFAVFQRIGGSLDSLNAATLENYTWEQPGRIGFSVPSSGNFTTLGATQNVSFSATGQTVQLSPSGQVNINPGSVSYLDNINIGSNTQQPGRFTTLQANTGFACNGKTPQIAYTVGSPVASTAATNTTPYGFTTSTQANDIVTKLNAIITALKNNGIIV